VRMEAKRRAPDEIAARQRAAAEKRKGEDERRSRVELLFLVFGLLFILCWRRSLALRLRLRARGRRLLAHGGLSLLAGRGRLAHRGLSLHGGRGRLAHGGLSLLARRGRLAQRGLSLHGGRRCLAHWGLSLLAGRGRLAHWGLSLHGGRRCLAHWGLSLLAGRGQILRTRGRARLGLRVLVRQLPRTVLGLGRALGKGRRRSGAHGWGDRMNLFRVDRLDPHASRRRVLAGGLCAQSL
jgi:hypothetical protein